MKKLIFALVAVFGFSFCFAEGEASVVDVAENGRISLRCGYFSPLDGIGDFDLDGMCAEFDFVTRPFENKNIALGLRCSGGTGSAHYGYVIPGPRYAWPVGSSKLTYSDLILTAQLYVSLIRNENFDFYLTCGGYRDAFEFEYEFRGSRLMPVGYKIESDNEGYGGLAGIGIELKNNTAGICFEADYITKPSFDDDELTKIEDEKGQIEIFGSAMLFLNDEVAVDFSVRYFSEWQDLYAMVGMTANF